LDEVEVMGRDITVVSKHEASENIEIRSIISAEEKVDASSKEVRFSIKPNKLFLFRRESGERIFFEAEV
ncbi:MAG: ABC transporter ATP-binding protein, partial [Oscillospiraceae bacterium]|nr:ABC transporter ATP-binding protein [Oscillospiraceae bacterium]